MTREQLKDKIFEIVRSYTGFSGSFDDNPQICVNPATLNVSYISGKEMLDSVADAMEAVEESAASQGAASDEYTEDQVDRNPDFYPMSTLVKADDEGRLQPDMDAIEKVAANYL